MDEQWIAGVEWAPLMGERPRTAGSNARLGPHGRNVRVPLARLITNRGLTGFGFCRASRQQVEGLLGKRLDELFTSDLGVLPSGLAFEYPLWDLLGRITGAPVYALAAAAAGRPVPASLAVPCYDTSLYFDDLHLSAEADAAALLVAEARAGWEMGHRAFKIKVGRGARHLPLEEGTRRDIAIVHAVRKAVGPEAPLLLDANNGYNLNLTKRVLEETADCGVFWMEEAFHEDPVLYRDLKEWLKDRNLPVLIADGEGQASPSLIEWAREGFIDVIQYDVLHPGFTRWLELGRQLDAWGVRSAPHHYGAHYGNYAACHLAAAIVGFTFVEWDEATTPGLDASGYHVREGKVLVPNTPGFGLELDDDIFRRAMDEQGYHVP